MKIIVVGASGKMGCEIGDLAGQIKEIKEAIGVVRNGHAKNYDQVVRDLKKRPAAGSVVIDFSSVENLGEVASYCEKYKLPLISGVTGYSDAQLKKIKALSKTCPVLWSSNMSLGVSLLKKAIRELRFVEEFEGQIIEWHHNRKKDNPSGTAMSLQQELQKIHLKGLAKPVGFRAGSHVGTHEVHIVSDEEHLTFSHQALSRAVFAKGALKAALWIKNKKAGYYTMDDVLLG